MTLNCDFRAKLIKSPENKTKLIWQSEKTTNLLR